MCVKEEEHYWHWRSMLWQKTLYQQEWLNFISSFVFHHKMHLHVSIVLLFILLTEGFSLECYQCHDQLEFPCKETTKCHDEASRCARSRRVHYIAGRKQETIKDDCVEASECKSWSFTATPVRMEYSAQCCDTDMCNDRHASDLNSQPNGKKCYSCNWEGCSQTVDCMGNENHCFTANGLFPRSSAIMKGCASEFACGLAGPMTMGPGVNVTCCEGNLCNAVERVSQSFLFLCCSLILYFLINWCQILQKDPTAATLPHLFHLNMEIHWT